MMQSIEEEENNRSKSRDSLELGPDGKPIKGIDKLNMAELRE